MELGKQIKKYRTEQRLSQDELADKIYVTRQTVSNWENDRSYPDIRSLVLLSNVFGVSLDILVKGDLETMKEEIKEEDRRAFDRDGKIYTVLMIAMVVSPILLTHFLGWAGAILWVMLACVAICFAFRVEKKKKEFDIQTYREILAFSEGKRLDELEKNREIGKRPYQKFLLGAASGIIALLTCLLMAWLLK